MRLVLKISHQFRIWLPMVPHPQRIKKAWSDNSSVISQMLIDPCTGRTFCTQEVCHISLNITNTTWVSVCVGRLGIESQSVWIWSALLMFYLAPTSLVDAKLILIYDHSPITYGHIYTTRWLFCWNFEVVPAHKIFGLIKSCHYDSILPIVTQSLNWILIAYKLIFDLKFA